ncbi:MAG: membrane protein insertase YidC [Deltaproteobacteria bacterium]|nr:membrane protein insertase YidC [Deltaproteobacteria bacterium]
MSQELRALLAGALSLAVFLGWYYFFAPKALPPPTQSLTERSLESPIQKPESPTDFLQREKTSPEIVVSSLGNDLIQWEVSSYGGRIRKVLLNSYQQSVEKESPPIDMILSGKEAGPLIVCRDCNFVLPPDENYHLTTKTERELVYEAKGEGFVLKKIFRFAPDQYFFEVSAVMTNLSRDILTGQLGFSWQGTQKIQEKQGFFSFLKGPPDQRGFVYQIGGKLAHAGKKQEVIEERGNLSWIGLEDRYFLIALINRKISSESWGRLTSDAELLTGTLYPGAFSIPRNGTNEESFILYTGPKERERLKMLGVGLEKAVDYGFFSIFAIPILKLLILFNSFLKNWGLAIIFLTILVKLILNPLTVKSLKQMKEMQNLQPKLKEIREKYQNDKQRLNLETMQLFKNHKVNPLGGCLPMLIQMPLYIALYKVLYNSIELYHAPFFGFYRDLSAPDPYLILPVLLGIFMVLQQKMTPSGSADPAQRQMMMFMPILFTGFMLFLPLGLVLYIFVNTFMSVAQQFMYQRNLKVRDLPHLFKK